MAKAKTDTGAALRSRIGMKTPQAAAARTVVLKPHRKLQVRLREQDARRFIRLAEDQGYDSVQDALVAAMDRILADWGDRTPLHNPGANKADTER